MAGCQVLLSSLTEPIADLCLEGNMDNLESIAESFFGSRIGLLILILAAYFFSGCAVKHLVIPESATLPLKQYQRIVVKGKNPEWTNTNININKDNHVVIFSSGKVDNVPGVMINMEPRQTLFMKIGSEGSIENRHNYDNIAFLKLPKRVRCVS